jgi:hypothetical protein
MVPPGEFSAGDGRAYIDQLLDQGLIQPDTVVVVLIGPKAYSSKKLDWEIAAALEKKGSHPTGLVPIRCPNHEDHGKQSVNPRRIPFRIADNLKSGFLKLYDWTENTRELENRLHAAMKDARVRSHQVKNSRPLMQRDMFL